MKGMIAVCAALSAVIVSCEVTVNEGVVGNSTDVGLKNVSFAVDTTYMLSSPGTLVARGTATYTGAAAITSPWYIECFFYSDTTRAIVLGKGSTQIGVPLSPGQSVYWMISLYSDNVDVRRFPGFDVGGFAAVYRN